MVTCYDYSFACLIAKTDIDMVLVGDSASMVMHGFPNTTHATLEMMCLHTAAVSRGLKQQFLVADMPFMSYRQDHKTTMLAVQQLVQAGAHAIKLEGVSGNTGIIQDIVESGIPVMGHIGLTPQMVHQLGGFKVQGREATAQQRLLDEAKSLQACGCFAIVLECIPTDLAQTITQTLEIPTIGIGAGQYTDGQVLVLQDLLGLQNEFTPKFVKHYSQGAHWTVNAINQFIAEVRQQQFPLQQHSYHFNQKEPNHASH